MGLQMLGRGCSAAIASLAASLWLHAPARAAQAVVATVAGSDPSASALLSLEDARGIALDSSGNLYLADTARHRVLRLSPSGVLSLFAGTGAPGFFGDDGPATAAHLYMPYGVAADAAGNLYIADLGNARVRRVSPAGRITTFAGGGAAPVSSAPALATSVQLQAPRNVVADAAGNVYVSDFAAHRILRVTPDGRIAAVAGTGSRGAVVPSGAPLSTPLAFPAGLFLDPSGALWVADSGNHAIRRIAAGVMATIHLPGGFVDLPTAVAADLAGNLYIASAGYEQAVRIAPGGAASVIARQANDLTVDSVGNVYVAAAAVVRQFSPTGSVTVLAGGRAQFRGDGGPATEAWLDSPNDVKSDGRGGFFVADTRNHRIRHVSATGVIRTVAANLNSPQGLAMDPAGNLYIADTGNHRIRRLAPDGSLTVVAGTGVDGFNGEAREALQAHLSSPAAVAVDLDGTLLIADTGNHRIRRLTASGYVMTIAGASGRGFSGDGLGSFTAQLDSPRALAVDAFGNLYVADSGNRRIRRISSAGAIATVAQDLVLPAGLAVDANGSVYASDAGSHRVLRLHASGAWEPVAGAGMRGFAADPGPALEARLDEPAGLSVDRTGALLIADRGNHRIRRVSVAPAGPSASAGSVSGTRPEPSALTPVRALHAASLRETVVAPGMLLTLSGLAIGPETPVAGTLSSSGALGATLGGVEVRFDGAAAPILYAQRNLLNIQAPYRLAGQGRTELELLRDGVLRARLALVVEAVAPALFTLGEGSGPANALLEDGSLHGEGNPALPGAVVTLLLTGEGVAEPPLLEGQIAPSPSAPAALLEASIGGQAALIISARAAAASPGILELRVRVPAGLPPGAHPVTVRVGGRPTQDGVRLWVRARDGF